MCLLLVHPGIDVNLKDHHGSTPFLRACVNGHTSCVRLLLKDSRVKVNEPDKSGYPPLRWCAYQGRLDIIKWWIASGREIDLGKPGNSQTDAVGQAKKQGNTEVAALLERLQEQGKQEGEGEQEEVRHGVRREVGWYDEAAVEMFAVVVFVSDGLLQVTQGHLHSPAARFISIARHLPLELQMILFHYSVSSNKEVILRQHSEHAFIAPARCYY